MFAVSFVNYSFIYFVAIEPNFKSNDDNCSDKELKSTDPNILLISFLSASNVIRFFGESYKQSLTIFVNNVYYGSGI